MASQESIFILNGLEALSTIWFVEVFESLTSTSCHEIQEVLIDTIYSFEKKYSRFNESSLLSELNSKRMVNYDYHLAMMLTKGKEMGIVTEGVFDLFIKEQLEDKGYGVKGCHADNYSDSDSDFVITEEVIQLKGEKSIDLGGLGKGYLLDVLAEILKKRFHINEFLINGGGDMYGTHQGGDDIVVYIQNPEDRNILIGSVGIKNQSLCASSSYVRSWVHGDRVKNHFIAKNQKEVWAASFVVGDSAILTDMLATVFCINSHDKRFCGSLASQTGAAYYVMPRDEASFGNLEFTPAV